MRALWIALLLAACDSGRFLVVQVDAPASAPAIVQLHISAMVGSAQGNFTAPATSGAPLRWPETFSLELPDGSSPMGQLSITGLDATGCAVLSASGPFSPPADGVAHTSLTLGPVTGGSGCASSVPLIRATSFAAAQNGAALILDQPAGTAQGDLLIAFVAHDSGTQYGLSIPAGWTPIPNTDFYAGAADVHIYGFSRVVGVSPEPPSYVFAMAPGYSYDMIGGIYALTGADPTSPINASGGQGNTQSSTTCTAPSITTTVASTLVLFGCVADNSTTTFTPPANMVEDWDLHTGGTFPIPGEGAHAPLLAAGPTGPRAALMLSGARSVAIQVAIAPLSAQTGP
jgi:hypothetical protein